MKYIGLYLNGMLVSKFEYTESGVVEAINACRYVFEETGLFHELKMVDEAK